MGPSAHVCALQVATATLELQEKLPKARVLYCSATGVSEVGNLAYMTRLGLWGPGPTSSETRAPRTTSGSSRSSRAASGS